MSNTFPTVHAASATPDQFVDFWRAAYSADPSIYNANIQRGGMLTNKNVQNLMEWKAGKRFATRAREWAARVGAQILNAERQGGSPLTDDRLRDLFSRVRTAGSVARGGGATLIWPLFLCHAADPEATPIYDVNTWRAALHITGEWLPRYERQRPATLATYLEWYRPWFAEVAAKTTFSAQELDEALMAFGQFTRTQWWKLLD